MGGCLTRSPHRASQVADEDQRAAHEDGQGKRASPTLPAQGPRSRTRARDGTAAQEAKEKERRRSKAGQARPWKDEASSSSLRQSSPPVAVVDHAFSDSVYPSCLVVSDAEVTLTIDSRPGVRCSTATSANAGDEAGNLRGGDEGKAIPQERPDALGPSPHQASGGGGRSHESECHADPHAPLLPHCESKVAAVADGGAVQPSRRGGEEGSTAVSTAAEPPPPRDEHGSQERGGAGGRPALCRVPSVGSVHSAATERHRPVKPSSARLPLPSAGPQSPKEERIGRQAPSHGDPTSRDITRSLAATQPLRGHQPTTAHERTRSLPLSERTTSTVPAVFPAASALSSSSSSSFPRRGGPQPLRQGNRRDAAVVGERTATALAASSARARRQPLSASAAPRQRNGAVGKRRGPRGSSPRGPASPKGGPYLRNARGRTDAYRHTAEYRSGGGGLFFLSPLGIGERDGGGWGGEGYGEGADDCGGGCGGDLFGGAIM